MRKTIYFVLTAILLLSFSLSAQERAKLHVVTHDQDGSAGALVEQISPSQIASLPVNEVDSFVENIRCILGAGRNVARAPNGNIHGQVLEGTTGSYELYWVGSTDDGVSWTTSDHLGSAVADDDRYASVDFNATGSAYLAYTEDFGAGKGNVVYLPDPFLDPSNFVNSGEVTNVGEQNVHGTVAVDKNNGHVAYGFSNRVEFQNYLGFSTDGTTFPATVGIGNISGADTFRVNYAPTMAIDGNYAFVIDINMDGIFSPTDTAAHLGGSAEGYYIFWESSDGGATWTEAAPVYGFSLGDFPTVIADRNGTTGPIAAAGGDRWESHTEPIIHNGNVYFGGVGYAVTLNDGTFPYAFWDGFALAVAGFKPASMGGSWTHRAPVGLVADAGDNVVSGAIQHTAISALPGTGIMALSGMDRAPAPSDFVVILSTDNGDTWDGGTAWNAATELGIVSPTANIFPSPSKNLHLAGNDVSLDLFYLGDDGGVVNTTVYHVLVPVTVTSIDENGSGVPEKLTLNQNFPNPFNPTTQIRFELTQASEVTLDVHNALGQKVATLVNGTVQAGSYSIQFDGAGLSSGVYFYTLQAGDISQTKKMMLVK